MTALVAQHNKDLLGRVVNLFAKETHQMWTDIKERDRKIIISLLDEKSEENNWVSSQTHPFWWRDAKWVQGLVKQFVCYFRNDWIRRARWKWV